MCATTARRTGMEKMIKPEPLKGKRCEMCGRFHGKVIRAAVELYRRYLKREIRYARNVGNVYAVKLLSNAEKELNKDFEDVVKDEQN